MADGNVFGYPMTRGTRLERAEKAYRNQNAGEKRYEVLEFIRKEKENYGDGSSTLCVFYNATGEELILDQDESFFGKIYDAYPKRVQNGQWGAFLHVKTAIVPSGSMGFVVYRGKYNDTDYCNHLIGWDTPWEQLTQTNHAYSEIFDDGRVDSPYVLSEKISGSGFQHVSNYEELRTEVKTTEATSPLFEALLFLVPKRKIIGVHAEESSA